MSSTLRLQYLGHQVISATSMECVVSTFGQPHHGEKVPLDMIASLLIRIPILRVHPDLEGACSFEVARVFLFFSFTHCDKVYSCALVQWFSFVYSEPDEDTGLWIIEPEFQDTSGDPHLAVIHTDSICRAVHLIPAYRTAEKVSTNLTMHSSLDTFPFHYINKFADHHAFETLF